MAKSKNHSAHNQERKNHRNGIKKPTYKPRQSYKQSGLDPKFLHDLKFSRKNLKRTRYVRGDMQPIKPSHQRPSQKTLQEAALKKAATKK